MYIDLNGGWICTIEGFLHMDYYLALCKYWLSWFRCCWKLFIGSFWKDYSCRGLDMGITWLSGPPTELFR